MTDKSTNQSKNMTLLVVVISIK